MADPLFETLELTGSQRIGLSNDGYDIDTRRKATHELNIHFSQAMDIN